MSKSYKSALPTWTTYTPYVSPLSTQAPINQETWWRNRARQWQPPSIMGQLNRIAGNIDASVKGTGAAHAVGDILGHRPLMAEAGKHTAPIRNLWANQMREAVQHGTPETMTAPGEELPVSEMQVRARTAAPSVNPTAVQQQSDARDLSGTMVAQAVGSSKAGENTLNMNVGPASEPKKLWTPPRLQPNRVR